MPKVIEVQVTGLRELQQALEQKPRNIARKLLRTVLRKAASIWRDEMALLAPKLAEVKLTTSAKSVRIPGDLSRHIGMSVRVNSELEGTVDVGPLKRVFWGRFAEFGQSGKHQQAAHPFIRPAFESKTNAVLDKIVEEGKAVVQEEGGS